MSNVIDETLVEDHVKIVAVIVRQIVAGYDDETIIQQWITKFNMGDTYPHYVAGLIPQLRKFFSAKS